MHPKLSVLLVSLLVLAGSGCASRTARMQHVHLGMTRAEVMLALGRPDRVRTQSNVEYLTYYVANLTGAREQPLMVRLVNNRVETFGKFVALADVYGWPGGTASAQLGALMPHAMNTNLISQAAEPPAVRR